MPMGADLACPMCQGPWLKHVSGEEFYLEAIDVETEAEAQPA
jgi:hypothetical protein